MNVLLILTASPYGSDIVYNGLRLAAALQAEASVKLFLMSDAVGAAIEGQAGANEDSNLGSRLSALVKSGVEVKLCGLCFETRGYHNAPIVEGVQLGTVADLGRWVLGCERVISM